MLMPQLQSTYKKYLPHLEVLFVLALSAAVRLTDLGRFRVVDEEDRWAWAVDFFRALLAGDLRATLIGDGYPGVFPVWLETVWLFIGAGYRSILQGQWIGDGGVYLLIDSWENWSNLAIQRFPVVLANTVLVVLIFLCVRKLFGSRAAILAAILISLDPFYLSDSRVNRAEGLLTGLMTLSLLTLMLYHRHRQFRYLALSAAVGGLAWLTKSQSIVLLPMFAAINLLWAWRTETTIGGAARRWLAVMVDWSIGAALIFAALWPAVWVAPADTFGLMFRYATRKVGADGVNLFFLGRTLLDEDPGWLFYPVTFALRVTPVMLFGLLLGIVPGWKDSIGAAITDLRDTRFKAALQRLLDAQGVWALVVYSLLYAGGMSLGSHKQDRFLMAIFPALGILAALALSTFIQRRRWSPRKIFAAVTVVLALQLATALPYHPYYFSYFNPLLGGGATAQKLVRIGWGEGMDQVADYLNSLENPQSLTVSTRFYKYLLNFKGQAFNLDSSGEWLTADKIVFYIQQSQRLQDPSPGVIHYFQQHISPEKVITINGIDYASVYPNPVEFPARPQVARADGVLALFGYRVRPAEIELVWENLAQSGSARVGIKLAGETGATDWLDCALVAGFEGAAQIAGEVVESRCPLATDGLPPGLYTLQVGFADAAGRWQALDFVAGWSALEVNSTGEVRRIDPAEAYARLADQAIPADAVRLPERYYGDAIQLAGYRLGSAAVVPGQAATLTLYWQAVAPLRSDDDWQVSVQAFAGDSRLALRNGIPANGLRPTNTWRPGEVITDAWTFDIPPDAPVPALLRLDVSLFRPDTLVTLPVQTAGGEQLPATLTTLKLTPPAWPVYSGDNRLDFTFAEAIHLTGYDLSRTGDAFDVTLYWHSLAPLDEDFTAFVQILAPDGTLVAQSDVAPANGVYPVSAWQPGETVLSVHRLQLPAEMPSGDTTLIVGLYRPGDWSRLPVTDSDGISMPDDAAPIGTLK